MKSILHAMKTQEPMSGLPELLHCIVSHRDLHARLLNTLARMEYVGVRKMVKARHSDFLTVDGLQHMLEESAHALRLKKYAIGLAESPGQVKTFSSEHTLGGDAGEQYLQDVDAACAKSLEDMKDPQKTEMNYLLSSAMIEFRAEVFYPVYEDCLRKTGASFSISAILKDEERHLAQMIQSLEAHCPDWEVRCKAVQQAEAAAFSHWMKGVSESMEHALAVI